MFDLPLPYSVLQAHAAVAALDVQHTAVSPLLLRRFEKPVDPCSIDACGSTDEQWHSERVVGGNGSGLSGGMLSALHKQKTTSEKEQWQACDGKREGGRGGRDGGGGRGPVCVQLAAANLTLRFSTSQHFHMRCV